MKIIVFLGPTLPLAQARARLDADYRPPVGRGDVYRAALEQPFAIGIVDGVFRSQPAVWHKEILWALNEGIHVLGGASMGALRAAELAPFGMVGVGRVFQQFESGALEDDDEVAVTHGPAELGFVAASEAMVDIRPTLQAAAAAGVLQPAQARDLEAQAKSLFYADRDYARLLRQAEAAGMERDAVERLRAWLPQGRVEQKRADALDLLDALHTLRQTAPGRPPGHFFLEGSLGLAHQRADPAGSETLADAAPGDPALSAAFGWWQARAGAQAAAREVEAVQLLAASREFCQRHGLADGQAVDRWLHERGATRGDLLRVLATRVHLLNGLQEDPAAFRRALADYLLWSGGPPGDESTAA